MLVFLFSLLMLMHLWFEKTGVLRSLKLCDCRWRSKSGSMNNLRYEFFALRRTSHYKKSSTLVRIMESSLPTPIKSVGDSDTCGNINVNIILILP